MKSDLPFLLPSVDDRLDWVTPQFLLGVGLAVQKSCPTLGPDLQENRPILRQCYDNVRYDSLEKS